MCCDLLKLHTNIDLPSFNMFQHMCNEFQYAGVISSNLGIGVKIIFMT
jgi:hypothetical protein